MASRLQAPLDVSPPGNTHARGPRLQDLVRLARPHHWVKNVFVLLPIPFALADRHGAGWESLEPWAILWGLLGFSLVNSAVYVLNDVIDADADRRHPRKQSRPVAADRISASMALGLSAALLAGGLAASAASSASALMLSGIYLGINVFYCLVGKNIPLIDVFLLSSGFVLRVLLGCALVDAAPSDWLLVCTSSLSLFLALTKRRADVISGLGAEHRRSLSGYNLAFLDQATSLLAGITLLAYVLYTINSPVLLPSRRLANVPFVAFGVLNYLRLAQVEGWGGSPVEVFYRSRAIQLCGLGWVVAVLWALEMP